MLVVEVDVVVVAIVDVDVVVAGGEVVVGTAVVAGAGIVVEASSGAAGATVEADSTPAAPAQAPSRSAVTRTADRRIEAGLWPGGGVRGGIEPAPGAHSSAPTASDTVSRRSNSPGVREKPSEAAFSAA